MLLLYVNATSQQLTDSTTENNMIDNLTVISILPDSSAGMLPNDQWNKFLHQSELWKKCGFVGENDLAGLPALPSGFKFSSHGMVAIQSQYNSGSPFTGVPMYLPSGFYSTISGSNTLQVAQIPFTVTGTAVLQNGQLKFNYSTADISFDQQKLIDALKQRLKISELTKAAQNLNDLPLGVLDSLSNLDAATALASDENLLQQYVVAQSTIDSIKAKAITGALSKTDSLAIDSMNQIKATYDKAQEAYQSLVTLYQKYGEKIKDLERKLHRLKKAKAEIESLSDPSAIINRLEGDSLVSKKEKFLTKVKQFHIGSGSIDISKLTVENFLYKGGKTEIQSRDLYISAGVGMMQSFPFAFSSFTATPGIFHRSVGYITAGSGRLDTSYFHGSLIYLHDDASSYGLGTVVIPKTNWIGSLRKNTAFGKTFSLYTEAALSSLNFSSSKAESGSLPTASITPRVFEKIAADVVLTHLEQDDHTSLIVRYIGPSYITLGNFTTIPNRLHGEIEHGTKLFDRRLEASVSAYYERAVSTTLIGYSPQRWGVTAKGKYYLPKNGGFISLSWKPDQLTSSVTQLSSATDISSLYQQLSVSSFISYRLFTIQAATFSDISALFGNYRFNEQANATVIYTGSLMQRLSFTGHQLVVQGYGTTYKNTSSQSTSNVFVQATDAVQLKKIGVTYGGNWIQSSIAPSLVGVIIGANVMAAKLGMVSINYNLRSSLGKGQSLNEYQQLLTASLQVGW